MTRVKVEDRGHDGWAVVVDGTTQFGMLPTAILAEVVAAHYRDQPTEQEQIDLIAALDEAITSKKRLISLTDYVGWTHLQSEVPAMKSQVRRWQRLRRKHQEAAR